jgi:hypothetical protein
MIKRGRAAVFLRRTETPPSLGLLMGQFDLVVQASTSLNSYEEPSDFITAYEGVIRYTRDDGRAYRVGRLSAYRIQAGLAADHGESLFDVCDAHSQSTG